MTRFDPQSHPLRIRGINPFVVELNGRIVAYADLQSNGYIDRFFVPGKHLLNDSSYLALLELTSDVSRTARPFFETFGFEADAPILTGRSTESP